MLNIDCYDLYDYRFVLIAGVTSYSFVFLKNCENLPLASLQNCPTFAHRKNNGKF